MLSEQRLRAFLFYLSLAIFLMGLPPILSSTLGYKFNRRTFKFTKAGLVVLKTQPAGASIYLDKQLLNIKTPATINELLPGRYNIRFELEEHYPWFNDIEVEAGKVTRLEKIILFPLRSSIKQLNKDTLSVFMMDDERETIYYITQSEDSIYKSDLEGEHFEKIGNFIKILPSALKWKVSPDHQKLLYFNTGQIGVTNLASPKENLNIDSGFVLDYPEGKIIDVFWYSDSYHLILVSSKSIQVLEARPRSQMVELVTLTKKNTSAYYDIRTDTLYFLDSQKAADGNLYDNLYKIHLDTRVFILQ
jgi:hypothetical protein